MNKKKFLQTDSGWGGLGYPKKPWYIRNCGCGEVSIANCIIEMDKYANYTPATIQPYCKQFAAPNGDGTYFSGIPKMMKNYGMTEVQEHATMTPLWNELAKGDRVAIYLMGKKGGGSKKVHWTSGGHFVCSVDYKYENGKHYVYVKDSYSSSSLRNGWISYEENMKGDVLKVWSGKIITVSPTSYRPTTPYAGTLPTSTVKEGMKNADSKAAQTFLNWCIGTNFTSGKFGEKSVQGAKVFQKTYGIKVDGIFGSQSIRKAKEIIAEHSHTPKGYDGEYPNPNVSVSVSYPNSDKLVAMAKSLVGSSSSPTAAFKSALNKAYPSRGSWGAAAKVGKSCDVFVGTVVRSLGWDKDYPRGLAEQYLYKPNGFTRKTYKNVTPYSVSKDGQIIIYSKEKVPTSKNKKSCKGHTCIRGNGVIYEANYPSKYPHINSSVKSKLGTKRPYVVVLTPTGTYSTTTTRAYLERGDKGEDVKKLQKYINWFFHDKYGKDVISVDGNYGAHTESYCKLMQKELGFTDCDGLVGAKTIAAMKAYKR